MRRISSLVVLSLVVATACQDTSSPTAVPDVAATLNPVASSPQAQDRIMPGEVLMAVRSGVNPADVATSHGVSLAARGYADRFFVLRGAAGNERALAARIGGDARVLYAEPNWLRQPTTIDPKLWAFYNPGGLTIKFTQGRNKGKVVGSKISTDDADIDNVEGYASGGSPVVIGSIDTGVDFSHPEFLADQLIPGYDWYSGDADPSDTEGHGTHTTGTMVGQNVGVAGVSGAGSNVKVYVQRVCGAIGCPTSAIVSAIYAAADFNATHGYDDGTMVAMNLSLGGSSESQTERDAIAHATSNGVLVIASAGNNGTSTVSCPACDPNAISVAALNWQDQLSYFSNWGSGLDLSAPGGEMYSNTTEEGGIYSSVPGGYAYYQGTSMAAPMVTGAAAIIASRLDLTGASLRAALVNTADDLGAGGYDTKFGYGRVNPYHAIMGGDPPGEGGSSGGDTGGATLAASFTYNCSGLVCSFNGSASGTTGIVSWLWDFGDGGSATTEDPVHEYGGNGGYSVRLTVTDETGSADATQSITCKTRGRNGPTCN